MQCLKERIRRVSLLSGAFLQCLGAVTQADAGPKPYTRNVAIVIWDGAEVLDWAGPSEVFAAAAQLASHGDQPAFLVYTVSKTKQTIVSQGFVDVIPDYDIETAPKPDIIVLPGGGTTLVTNDPTFLAWVGNAAREAEVAISVCTGAFILGEVGLLKDCDATTWYNAVPTLQKRFPQARVQPGRRFVDNGRVVTTAGVSAGIDGSLHVIARLLGKYVADRTAEYMEYRWTPESYLGSQYPVLNPSLDERGRRRQQAGIYLREGDNVAAISLLEALVVEEPGDTTTWMQLAGAYYREKRYAQATAAYDHAATSPRGRSRALYNAACSASLAGDADRAMEYLQLLVDEGFSNRQALESDTDFDALRDDVRFKALLDDMNTAIKQM